jgi:hypothetical protein
MKKQILTPGEIIYTSKGLPTNLKYINDAGYLKNIRLVNVECIGCNSNIIKQLVSIKGGASNSCGNKSCKLQTTPLLKKIFTLGQQITDDYKYIGEDFQKSTTNHRYMFVECKCGYKTSIRTDAVKKNNSCPKCGQIKRRSTFSNKTKESIIKSLYNSYARQATKRGYTFDITYEIFKEFIFKDCYYCSTPPSNTAKQNYRSLTYNGIDRVDNSKGYHNDNIVPCCGECNWMKNKLSRDQFLNKVKKIFNNLKL